jgi:hypothetical protein
MLAGRAANGARTVGDLQGVSFSDRIIVRKRVEGTAPGLVGGAAHIDRGRHEAGKEPFADELARTTFLDEHGGAEV